MAVTTASGQGTAAAATAQTAPASQTLSRGIRILEILADERGPLAIDEIAHRLEVHRSIAYRLLRTLEDHGLVARDSAGRIALGARMAVLAAGVAHDLQAAAMPELTAVANELGMTCFLSVLDTDRCITLASVEPHHTDAAVVQRPGARHPVTTGAPGKAILSILPRAEWPAGVSERLREDVVQAAAQGYATSHDEVIQAVRSVAVPLSLRGQRPAAIAVVYLAKEADPERIAASLQRAARLIRSAIEG